MTNTEFSGTNPCRNLLGLTTLMDWIVLPVLFSPIPFKHS